MLAIVALAGLTASGLSAKDFVLAQNGSPAATIVTAAAPTENVRTAARELRDYVRKISGADLPITTDAAPPSGPLILVGPSRLTEPMAELKIPSGLTPQLREEGFVLSARADRLVLAGNDAGPYYGTRYAVVELLHRLGVRWFMPGEFGEVVPQRAHAQPAGNGAAPAPRFSHAQLLAAPPGRDGGRGHRVEDSP